MIFSKKPIGTNVPYWQASVTDDGSQSGRIRVNIFDGTIGRQAYGPAVRVDDGAWHHVVVAFDRDSGITVYVDGTNSKFTAGAMEGDISSAGEFLVGKATGNALFKGDLDEVAVYAGLLPADRVSAHYFAGLNNLRRLLRLPHRRLLRLPHPRLRRRPACTRTRCWPTHRVPTGASARPAGRWPQTWSEAHSGHT